MSVQKPIQLFKSANTERQPATAEDILLSVDKLQATIPDADRPALLENIMTAISLGFSILSKQQFDALSKVFDKKVAPAPRQLDINQKVSVEQVIHNYLTTNEKKLSKAVQYAIEAAEEEDKITKQLQEKSIEADYYETS
jgi:hypothetical protein